MRGVSIRCALQRASRAWTSQILSDSTASPSSASSVSRQLGLMAKMETGRCFVPNVHILCRSFASYSAEPMQASLPIESEEPMQASLPTPHSSADRSAEPKQPSLSSLAAQANPDNAASFVLMSNIYADGGKWDEVKKINDMRLKARAWKKPGKAYIEVKSKVHEFIVGDETHQESDYIYEKLRKMKRNMNRSGYVPNVDLILENRSNYDPFKPK